MSEFYPSLIVQSTAGHDKGVYYHILSLDGKYAALIDGKVRKLANPKRKSIKHLLPLGEISSPAREKLKNGGTVTNREIIKSLAAYKSGRAFDEGG